MQPRDLQAEQFGKYPPQARQVAVAHLQLLRQLPIGFVPSLLRQVKEYDFKFPAERASIDKELTCLSALSAPQRVEWFKGFDSLKISPALERFDWVNAPSQFVEQQSAYLWSTHQLDAFREAATAYGERLRAATPSEPNPMRRLGIAVIGQGVASYDEELFHNLRPHGTYFHQIRPEHGLDLLLSAVAERAKQSPQPYAHWYVDGAESAAVNAPGITRVSYKSLEGTRTALLNFMQQQIQKPGMGPEELRTRLAELEPRDAGMDAAADPVLSRFELKLLTEGSGTQIFSTTFAQWTAREALRRAQPLTLLVRFAPRQRQRPMNELLANTQPDAAPDLIGSLVDADMGAYYHWINQQRLDGANEAVFIAWFEGHNQAIAVGPTLARGVQSGSAMDLGQLMSFAMG